MRSSRAALDAVPSTVAPARFASWTAATPTPPAAACTSTVSPACSRPNSKRQSCAVPKAMGTQAAATRSAPSGTFQTERDDTATSSACDPYGIVQTTRSPTPMRSPAEAPTSITVPPHW